MAQFVNVNGSSTPGGDPSGNIGNQTGAISPTQVASGVLGIFQAGVNHANNAPRGMYESLSTFKNGKVITKALGKKLGLLGVGITVLDARLNGLENHHYADIAIGLTATFLLTTPIGAGVAGAYFAIDLATQAYSGRSITEHLFDPSPAKLTGP